MRAVIFSIFSVAACASHGAQPDCLPAYLALSSTPTGQPIAQHIDRPSLFIASNHGLAAYWFCQDAKGQITYWEVHGTPTAILKAGGASMLEMLYIKDRDASLAKLSATPCHRSEIADPAERQLCKELLVKVRTQWPQSSVTQSP
jgi:hypothetical protein